MKIAIIFEGETEKAFLPHLRRFLQTRLAGRMPKLDPFPCDGRIPKGVKLKQEVERLLSNHNFPPLRRIRELFLAGNRRRYIKTRDAGRILRGKDLVIAAQACPELKAFLNTILTLCQAEPLA